jgi:RNA polymerase sigma factor (sigma-70 family)
MATNERHQPAFDRMLINRVRAGDQSAEHLLYRTYAAPALRRARQLGAQQADAEDYVAEAFLRVLRQLRQGGGPDGLFAPYLYAALRNLAADAHRGQRGRELPTDQIGTTIDLCTHRSDPEDEVATRMSVHEAMDELPYRWRDVLWRMHVEGQSPSALAEELGATPQSVSALAYRARKALRCAYEESNQRSA